MADSNRSTIIVAVLGLVGTLGAAVIANWDKIMGTGPVEPSSRERIAPVPEDDEYDPPPSRPARTAANEQPSVNLTGIWRDPNYPMNYSRITQAGESIRFDGAGTTEDGIGFRTSGSGALTGLNVALDYATAYQTGQQVRGSCTGSVTASGARMTLTCTDPLSGTFVFSSVKD